MEGNFISTFQFFIVLCFLGFFEALSHSYDVLFRTMCGCRVRVELSTGEKRSRSRGPPPSWSRRPRDDFRRRSPPVRRRYEFPKSYFPKIYFTFLFTRFTHCRYYCQIFSSRKSNKLKYQISLISLVLSI